MKKYSTVMLVVALTVVVSLVSKFGGGSSNDVSSLLGLNSNSDREAKCITIEMNEVPKAISCEQTDVNYGSCTYWTAEPHPSEPIVTVYTEIIAWPTATSRICDPSSTGTACTPVIVDGAASCPAGSGPPPNSDSDSDSDTDFHI